MQSTLWVGQRQDENTHWTRRDCVPITAIVAWVGGIVATALVLFSLGMIGH